TPPAETGIGDAGFIQCGLNPSGPITLADDLGSVARAVALASASEGALAVWAGETRGLPNLLGTWIPASGEAGRRIAITEDGFVQRTPTVARAAEGYLATWVGNESGTLDLRAAALTIDGEPAAERLELDPTPEEEQAPFLLFEGNDGWILWTDAGGTGAWLRSVDSTGVVTGSAINLAPPDQSPRFITAAVTRNGRTLVAWQNGSQVWARLLDDGTPAGSAFRVDVEGGATGRPAIATGVFGSAIAYDVRVDGVRPEFRVRLFDGEDELLAPIPAPLPAGEEATGAAIAPLAEGFAAIYRASEDSQAAMIRLVTLNAQGDAVQRFDIASTEPVGGASTIVATPEGALVFAWSERTDAGARLLASSVQCSR
ncbi:MAG: hypothetical protein AAF938_13620, partial [Myxococcota bacterium]